LTFWPHLASISARSSGLLILLLEIKEHGDYDFRNPVQYSALGGISPERALLHRVTIFTFRFATLKISHGKDFN